MTKPNTAELIINQDGSIYHLGLRPEDLGDVVFLVGDPDRVPVVSQYFDSIELKKQRREFNTHTGMLGSMRVTVMSTGMGTDNIDIALNELDALVNINLHTGETLDKHTILNIIRMGTTGVGAASTLVDSYLSSQIACGFDTLGHYYDNKTHLAEVQKAIQNELTTNGLDLPFYLAQSNQSLHQQVARFCKPSMTFTWPGFYGPQGRRLRIAPKHPHLLSTANTIAEEQQLVSNFEMETAGILLLAECLQHRAISINTVLANRATGEFSRQPEKAILGMIEQTLECISSLSITSSIS